MLTGCLLGQTAWAVTDGPLQVRRISPSGADVTPSQEAVIQFDRAMVPLGHMGRKSSELPVSISPDPGCQWRWLNTSELACRLPGQTRFRPATHYTVTVGTALKALDGSQLAEPVVRHFTTRLPAIDWANFERWSSPVQPHLSVRLNLPVTAKMLAAHLTLVDKQGHVFKLKVTPFDQQREGPVFVPVPGHPGALLAVDNPQPDKPIDSQAKAGAPRRLWKITPDRPLAPATSYTLKLSAGLRSPLGALPGEAEADVTDITSYGAFAVNGVQCRIKGSYHAVTVNAGEQDLPRCLPKSINFLFSAPVPRATLAAIDWQPMPMPRTALAKVWHNYPQWFLRDRQYADADVDYTYPLTFGLRPMYAYRVTIPAGVKDTFGRKLAKPVTIAFRTGHRVPFTHLPPGQAVLEADEPTIMPLSFTNIDTLPVSYRLLRAGDLDHGGTPAAARTTDLLDRPSLKPVEDRIVLGKLGVRGWLDGYSGVAWGDFYPHTRYARPYFGEVTPWQVFAKVGHYDTLVWLRRWDNGQPVAGAGVKLLQGAGNDLSQLKTLGTTATTGPDGLAVLPGAVSLPDAWFKWGDDLRFYVGATRAGALGLLPLNNMFSVWNGRVGENTAPPNGHLRAWAVTEDGIYKPGSDIQFALFVRAEGATRLKAPPALDYTLTITDPQGNDVLTQKHVKLDAFGGMHGKLHIATNAPMGHYRIELRWPTVNGNASREAGSFLVTDFVPAAFKVTTTVRGTALHPGDKVATELAATLHAGGPYTDAKSKITTELVARTFAPDAEPATRFAFGDATQSLPDAKTLAITDGKLDHAGRARTSVTLPAKSDVVYGEVKVEGAVQSARGKWIANDASVPYIARDRFVGLRIESWMQTAGKPFKVDYLVVDPQGLPAAGSQVRLVLKQERRTRVRVKNGAGDFGNEEHVDWVAVDHCDGTSARAPASCELTPAKAGRYRIVATVKDTHGRAQRTVVSTWVTGTGWITWSSDSRGVTMVPDKTQYHVGDMAHVLVQNPYPGARALLTVERYGVLWKKVVTLKGSAPVVDVPITASDFPGAYLSVTIFSPRKAPPADPDLGKPQVAMGYVPLKVVGKGSSLDVTVTPAKTQYKPRQTVDVDVAVAQRDGKAPGKTRLVVTVLDQGVLDLLPAGKAYFDPRQTFYAPPSGPDMVNYSLANQLLTKLEPKVGKGINPGGGGGESAGPNVRSNFQSAAFWTTTLTTDAAGHAHFHFKLPDNLTRWRILVVAMRPAAAMGLGDGSVRVNLPLQVAPALPNQVRTGDHFGAAFNATNRTQGALSVATKIDATGAIAGASAQTTGALDLASFGHGLTWLKLTAAQPGTITLTGSARAGTLGDAALAHIPVNPAGTPVTAAQYGSTVTAGASVPVKVPAKAVPGTGKVTVRFAPTLVGGLAGAFDQARKDDFRFWEARMSRAVLASDYLRLKPVIGQSVAWPKAGDVIGKELDSAADFQAPNGGMTFWIARNEFVSDYLSVYTALGFDWLRQAGHTVPANVNDRLLDYLRSKTLDSKWLVLRAGSMAALAQAPDGKLPQGAVAGLVPQLPKMRLFGQALLLDAAIAVHDRDSADTIVKSLLNNAEESAGEISFNQHREFTYADILATPLRANCAILDALSRYHTAYGDENLVGTVPQKLMRWVGAQRATDGAWPNSQENVFCTTATTHYADAYEKPVKSLTGTLELPGAKPQTATFASRATPAVKLAGPTAQPGQMFDVKLARGGQGRLYYGVQVHYMMRPDALPAADAGMTLSRQYFVQDGTKWLPVTDKTRLKRGDIVLVALTVDAPTMRHHVVLTDPLPGGFEAVNRNLAGAPALAAKTKVPGMTTLMFTGGAWPDMSIVTSGFYHRETAFDQVRFFADDLPAGHYQVMYSAQVIAPGTFTAPAPIIKEIYQPDVFGRGVTQHVDVAMPGQ
ncbi:MAG TPA: MG2 domain-containing protein [Rhodanobacteraceae bacterium]